MPSTTPPPDLRVCADSTGIVPCDESPSTGNETLGGATLRVDFDGPSGTVSFGYHNGATGSGSGNNGVDSTSPGFFDTFEPGPSPLAVPKPPAFSQGPLDNGLGLNGDLALPNPRVGMMIAAADRNHRVAVQREAIDTFQRTARPTLSENIDAAAKLAASMSPRTVPSARSEARLNSYLTMRAELMRLERQKADALRERVLVPYENAEQAHDACTQAYEFLGDKHPQRKAFVDVADILADAASDEQALGNAEGSAAALHNALVALDIALDFVPGVSAAKDGYSIIAGTNPVTGEALSEVERALLLAQFFAPGALRGSIRAVTHSATIVGRVAARSVRSSVAASALLPAFVEAARIVDRYGLVVEEVFASPRIQQIATRWGTSAGGLNQLLPHTISKALGDPNRLRKIESYAEHPVGSVSGIITDGSRHAVERSMATLDTIAHEVTSVGERWAQSETQNWFWKAAGHDAGKGIIVATFHDKIQTVWTMKRQPFVKMMEKKNVVRNR